MAFVSNIADASNNDSLSLIEVAKAIDYEIKGNIKKAQELFDEAMKLSSNYLVKRDYFAFLLRQNEYGQACGFIAPPSNNFEYLMMAEYYAKVGAIKLRAGPDLGSQSFSSFMNADEAMLKCDVKDYWLWSQIKLGLCYTFIISRTRFTDSGSDDEFSVLRIRDLDFLFQEINIAVEIDRGNSLAQMVLDSIKAKYLELGIEIPRHKSLNQYIEEKESQIEKNQAVVDSLNKLRVNHSKLPKNMPQLITHLNKYDEIALALDYSGSMTYKIFENLLFSPQRIESLKEIIKYIFKKLKENTTIGLITVEGECADSPKLNFEVGANRIDLLKQIQNLAAVGGTPLNNRIEDASELFSMHKNKKLIALVTDGTPSCGGALDICRISNKLKSKGIDIVVLSLLENKSDMSNAYQYAIYHCITESNDNKLFHLDEHGSISESKKNTEKKAMVTFNFPHLKRAYKHSPDGHFILKLNDIISEDIDVDLLDILKD